MRNEIVKYTLGGWDERVDFVKFVSKTKCAAATSFCSELIIHIVTEGSVEAGISQAALDRVL